MFSELWDLGVISNNVVTESVVFLIDYVIVTEAQKLSESTDGLVGYDAALTRLRSRVQLPLCVSFGSLSFVYPLFHFLLILAIYYPLSEGCKQISAHQ